MAELGIVGAQAYEWNGMFVPSGVSPEIVAKLADALKVALDSKDVQDRISQVGGEIFKGDRAAADKFISTQIQVMGKVIKNGNIRPE